jgi:hypothetical protein
MSASLTEECTSAATVAAGSFELGGMFAFTCDEEAELRVAMRIDSMPAPAPNVSAPAAIASIHFLTRFRLRIVFNLSLSVLAVHVPIISQSTDPNLSPEHPWQSRVRHPNRQTPAPQLL